MRRRFIGWGLVVPVPRRTGDRHNGRYEIWPVIGRPCDIRYRVCGGRSRKSDVTGQLIVAAPEIFVLRLLKYTCEIVSGGYIAGGQVVLFDPPDREGSQILQIACCGAALTLHPAAQRRVAGGQHPGARRERQPCQRDQVPDVQGKRGLRWWQVRVQRLVITPSRQRWFPLNRSVLRARLSYGSAQLGVPILSQRCWDRIAPEEVTGVPGE